MASLNACSFIGNLGRDPEMRFLPDGTAVASISIGVTEKWKDKNGERKEATEWIRASAFGKLGEIIGEYAKKGASVYVAGKLRTRKYTDKAGVEKYSTEIVADSFQLLDRKAPEARSGNHQPSPSAPPDNFDDTDIPF